jgi:hypothetical protein
MWLSKVKFRWERSKLLSGVGAGRLKGVRCKPVPVGNLSFYLSCDLVASRRDSLVAFFAAAVLGER